MTKASRGTPCSILSAGVDHEKFVKQLRVAMLDGASGAIVGRALWKDCISLESELSKQRLEDIAVPRLNELKYILLDATHSNNIF